MLLAVAEGGFSRPVALPYFFEVASSAAGALNG